MKVTVTKYLNVRVGKPSLNAPCYQYLAPGSEIEVDGKLYKGDKDDGIYEGIDTWMKDEAGNYYWSGGFEKTITSSISINYLDYFKNYNFAWINNKGKGVEIIVIDAGIILNKDYFDNSHIKQINLADDNNALCHGNFICGIIGGIGPVYGVSNKADILSIKYYSNTSNDLKARLNNLISSLQTAISSNLPTVINLSQGFYDFQLSKFSSEKDKIIDLIESLGNKNNSIIICSAGDNKDISDKIFPASLEHCISVGTISHEYRDIEIINKLDILTPMVRFSSYNNKFEVISDYGSSFSTAILSGLISSFISSKNNNKYTKADILIELKKSSTSRNNFEFDDLSKFQYNIL